MLLLMVLRKQRTIPTPLHNMFVDIENKQCNDFGYYFIFELFRGCILGFIILIKILFEI